MARSLSQKRPREDIDKFLKKQEEIREKLKQESLFELFTPDELKELTVVPERIHVRWQCNGASCMGHEMAIMDWEIFGRIRKVGIVKAIEHMKAILTSGSYEVGFLLSNFKAHPKNFTIAGVWYPKKHLLTNYELFENA